ncbi:hypothetical protein PoB_000527800 [Plakobranchus ocellatus]|uniref:Fibronectin type-III domain-containing protein n=1 Tax=Plakobranchus ocellatus TaxID=259542 RepID=A0AAV3Y9E1_9GAST|nr:hypothetical protein PoB_000527800 [Plakobranchus ocellatus]
MGVCLKTMISKVILLSSCCTCFCMVLKPTGREKNVAKKSTSFTSSSVSFSPSTPAVANWSSSEYFSSSTLLPSRGIFFTSTEVFNSSYELRILYLERTLNELQFAWLVTRGDVDRVDTSAVYMTDGIITSPVLQMNTSRRQIKIHDLIPGETYYIKVRAMDTEGVVLAENLIKFSTLTEDGFPSSIFSPEFIVTVDEIRHHYSLVALGLQFINTSRFSYFRLRVQDVPSKQVYFERSVDPDIRIYNITTRADRQLDLYVILKVIDHDGNSSLINAVEWTTPLRGEEGQSVSASSQPNLTLT